MDLLVEEIKSVTSFDLKIDSKFNDLSLDTNLENSILYQVIEAMEMSKADDIDFPNFFSNQRNSMNSEDGSEQNERIADVERILLTFPEINKESIIVDSVDLRIRLSFSLKSGQVVKRLL